MSDLPPPSRRVLAELRADRLVARGPEGAAATPVASAWHRLDAALETHAAALASVDRLAAVLAAAHGYPHVPLPAPPGATPDYAADIATIDRRVSDPGAAQRLRATLRRRRRRHAAAAEAAGLTAARRREARSARKLSAATSALLFTPAVAYADLALQLAVLIAAGEAGTAEAVTFPWRHLRAILASVRSDPANLPLRR